MAERGSTPASKSPGAPDPLLGRAISERFTIVGLIARGGMGRVYRAEQAPLGRTCAVKILDAGRADRSGEAGRPGERDDEFHKRFFLEASIASKLTHPNTVTIFDYGRTDDGVYFMAMEYLEGQTLHRAIREAGRFREDRAARVARQICRALREAHGLGVIHRDLKPANVFLVVHGDETDFVKILDFGLVKSVVEDSGEALTEAGVFLGSPRYMAPEQIRGGIVDARTDVYALGVLLFEMLVGRVPFDGGTNVSTMMAHLNDPVPPMRDADAGRGAAASPEMEALVRRCLAKDPGERFATMDAVLVALKALPSLAGPGATLEPAGDAGPDATSRTGFPRGVEGAPGLSTPTPGATPAPAVTASVSGNVSANGSANGSGSATGSRPGVLAPRASRGNRSAASVALALAAAFAVGIGAALAVRASRDPGARAVVADAEADVGADVDRAAPSSSTGASPASAAAVVAVPVPEATFALRSDPVGARVEEGGVEVCARTPCAVTYRGDDADDGAAHALVFAKAGFRAETVTVTVAEGAEAPRVRLGKLPAPLAARPSAPDGVVVPPGYKAELPY